MFSELFLIVISTIFNEQSKKILQGQKTSFCDDTCAEKRPNYWRKTFNQNYFMFLNRRSSILAQRVRKTVQFCTFRTRYANKKSRTPQVGAAEGLREFAYRVRDFFSWGMVREKWINHEKSSFFNGKSQSMIIIISQLKYWRKVRQWIG